MSAHEEFCQFCFRPVRELDGLVVSDGGESSICDRCAQLAVQIMAEDRHQMWLKLKDYAP